MCERPFPARIGGAGAGVAGAPDRRCVGCRNVADSATNNLVWIECDSTGLDLVNDKLIEVAVVVTDSQLNVLDPGLDIIIHADDSDLAGMVDVVREMHAHSGLTEEVRASTVT